MHTSALFALLGLGAFVRIRGLSEHSLWLGEAIAVHTATAIDPIVELLRNHHPPLSFLLLGAWIELVGQGDVALRMLSVLLSMLALVLFYRLATRWLEPTPALFAVAVFAVAPTQVWIGQEIQMHALLSCATLITLLGADRCLRPAEWNDGRRRGTTQVVFGTFLAFGTHYLGALLLPTVLALAVAASASGRVRLKTAVMLVCASALGLLLWLPWVLIVFTPQFGAVPELDFTAGQVDWIHLASLPIRQVLIWTSYLPDPMRLLSGVVGGILAGGIGLQALRFLAARSIVVSFPVLAFVVPILVLLVLVIILPIKPQPITLIIAAPGAVLSMAGGLAVLRPGWLRHLLFLLLTAGLFSITWLHGSQNLREDWRAAAADVVAAFQQGDLLFAITGTEEVFAQAPLRHYLRDHQDILSGFRDARPRIDGDTEVAMESGVRVHLVVRDVPAGTADRSWFESRMDVTHRGPVRNRIQHLQLLTR